MNWLPIGVSIVALWFGGCQQQMADQPSYKPLDPCEFFDDGRSARPLVEGAVARGHLHTDRAFFTGQDDKTPTSPEGDTAETPTSQTSKAGTAKGQVAVKFDESRTFVNEIPIPVNESVLAHGFNRYMIYCVVCHDPLGTGRGRIVERGYTAPPSYHIKRLRESPVGRLFTVVSEGYGSMPAYGKQIPPEDRWAIVAYLRALQLSQHFPTDDLTPEMRGKFAESSSSDVGAPIEELLSSKVVSP